MITNETAALIFPYTHASNTATNVHNNDDADLLDVISNE